MLVVLIPFAPTEAHSFCARCGFFFFFCCGLPVVVVVVVVVLAFSDLLWASGLVFVFVAVGLCSLWVFFFCCGLPVVVVVVVVVVPVVDSRGG